MIAMRSCGLAVLQKIARGLANEVDSFFNTAGHIKQQNQIERLMRGHHICHLPFDAVFINRKVRLLSFRQSRAHCDQ